MRTTFRARELVFVFIFTISQFLLVKALHVDIYANVLNSNWQFLDLIELNRHPLESLFLLHSQPPLINIIALFVIRLPGEPYQNFVLLNAFCTAVTCLIIYKICFYYQ